jgi:hypothetical protein
VQPPCHPQWQPAGDPKLAYTLALHLLQLGWAGREERYSIAANSVTWSVAPPLAVTSLLQVLILEVMDEMVELSSLMHPEAAEHRVGSRGGGEATQLLTNGACGAVCQLDLHTQAWVQMHGCICTQFGDFPQPACADAKRQCKPCTPLIHTQCNGSICVALHIRTVSGSKCYCSCLPTQRHGMAQV